MSFAGCLFIICPKQSQCWLSLMSTAYSSLSGIINSTAAFWVVPLGSYLDGGLLRKVALLLWVIKKHQNTTKGSFFLKSQYRRYLKVRDHVSPCESMCVFPCVLFFLRVCVRVFALSSRAARLLRTDTIRCIKTCQPGDAICVLDPTISVSHTFISLPSFREFTSPQGESTGSLADAKCANGST